MYLEVWDSEIQRPMGVVKPTWKMVLRRGLPDPCSRPMSWHQMFTMRTSAT